MGPIRLNYPSNRRFILPSISLDGHPRFSQPPAFAPAHQFVSSGRDLALVQSRHRTQCATGPEASAKRSVGSRVHSSHSSASASMGRSGRVEMWRGGGRLGISVSAPFVWRCLTGAAVAPFPHPAHRTGHADFPHPALGQGLTPSPTARCARARSGVPGQNGRTGARVDRPRPFVS
jgi:hypothetical protein